MGVNLSKGQKVSLTKDNPGLSELMIGLGWDPNTGGKKQKGGLFGALFGAGSSGSDSDFDLDSSVFMLTNGKLKNSHRDIVYYGHLDHDSRSVHHHGDNLTGGGDGDDERIDIYLNKIPSDYDRLVFVVNIYNAKTRHQDFGMVDNAFIRVVDKTTNKELLKYNLTGDYSNKIAMIFAEVYREDGEWKFNAIGEGTNDASISKMADRYK